MVISSRLLLFLYMARAKLTVRNAINMESHSDGQNAGYFPRTLRTVLLALGYSKPPLFICVPRLFLQELVPLVCACDHLREPND
jgi:hypothetical protein